MRTTTPAAAAAATAALPKLLRLSQRLSDRLSSVLHPMWAASRGGGSSPVEALRGDGLSNMGMLPNMGTLPNMGGLLTTASSWASSSPLMSALVDRTELLCSTQRASLPARLGIGLGGGGIGLDSMDAAAVALARLARQAAM